MPHRITALCCALVAGCAIALSGCARTPQQRHARFLQRGETLLAKKDYTRALLEFRNAARTLPNDAEAYYKIGLADLGLGNFNEAVLTFQRAVNLNPKHDAAKLKMAELMATSLKPDILQEVERMTKEVLSVDSGNSEALRVRALAELTLGKTDAAVASLEQSLEKAPKNLHAAVTLAATRLMRRDAAGGEAALKTAAQQANIPEGWIALCRYYRLIDRGEDAETALRKAVQVDPKNGEALFELAMSQLRARQVNEAGETFKRLAALDDAKYRACHAMFLFGSGQRAEAIKELEALVGKHRDDRRTRNQLVAAYLATQRDGDAGKLLDKALKANAKDADALEFRARIYLSAGKLPQAELDLNEALRFRSDSADAHYLKAKLLQAQNSPQYAQELEQVLRLQPDYLEARLDLSRANRAGHAPNVALQWLDKMPNSQKGLLGSIVERNWALFDLGRDAELKDMLTRALNARRDPELLLQQALLSMRQAQYPAAAAALDEILARNPENYRAVDTMLALYMAQKRADASVQWLKQHAARRPASAAMQLVLGQWLAATGDPAGARAAYSQAKTLDPKYKPAQLELAKMDLAAGNLAPAREALNRLLADDARDLPARMVLGAVEEKAEKPAEAMQQYQVVLAADPNHVVALNNLAFLLSEHTTKLDEALSHAERAYQQSPGSAAVNDTLGWIYYKKGMNAKAIERLAAAVRLQPTAQRNLHLAMAYQQDGQAQLAQKAMNEVGKYDQTAKRPR